MHYTAADLLRLLIQFSVPFTMGWLGCLDYQDPTGGVYQAVWDTITMWHETLNEDV